MSWMESRTMNTKLVQGTDLSGNALVAAPQSADRNTVSFFDHQVIELHDYFSLNGSINLGSIAMSEECCLVQP